MGALGEEHSRSSSVPLTSDVSVAGFHAELRIGKSLAQARRELMTTRGLMRDVLEPATDDLVNEAIHVLERQVFRIAIIGQIKAGKSTFINALVQQPDLLPTDVNPWTTAVTNLHFCCPHEASNSARFNFFAASEWQRLAEGGGRLRELTERLVPGFEPEVLRQHVSTLKSRAVARLGSEFADLLGRTHQFAVLSPDILRRYVCQGDLGDSAAANRSVGLYSDITKSADIYLGSGPFDYPVTVIDTPGTNDPFLIRDEITRQCLESADLYVVVLTARQALAASDIALLRILRGLQRERIVVFLNRIDELSDIASETEHVAAAIRRQLRSEFPGVEIPLVFGSAWWATCALAGKTPGRGGSLDRRAAAYMEQRGLLQRKDLARLAEGEVGNAVRDAMLAVSGLRQMYATLDEFLSGSHNARVLRQVTSLFTRVVQATESASRQELQSLSEGDPGESRTNAGNELARLRGQLQRLRQVSAIIDQSAILLQERLTEIATHELAHLRRRLLDKVESYALAERDSIANQLLAGKVLRTWRFDTQALRRELANEFLDGFRRAEARLLDRHQAIVPHLREVLAVLAPNAGSPDFVPRPVPPPTMASLGSHLAIDLDDSWWALLWGRRPAPLRRGRQLEALIRTEFSRVVDELIDACDRSLSEYVIAFTESSYGTCRRIARSIAERRQQLVTHYESVEKEIGKAADPQAQSERWQYIAMLKKRLSRCEAVRGMLERIGRQLSAVHA